MKIMVHMFGSSFQKLYYDFKVANLPLNFEQELKTTNSLFSEPKAKML